MLTKVSSYKDKVRRTWGSLITSGLRGPGEACFFVECGDHHTGKSQRTALQPLQDLPLIHGLAVITPPFNTLVSLLHSAPTLHLLKLMTGPFYLFHTNEALTFLLETL